MKNPKLYAIHNEDDFAESTLGVFVVATSKAACREWARMAGRLNVTFVLSSAALVELMPEAVDLPGRFHILDKGEIRRLDAAVRMIGAPVPADANVH